MQSGIEYSWISYQSLSKFLDAHFGANKTAAVAHAAVDGIEFGVAADAVAAECAQLDWASDSMAKFVDLYPGRRRKTVVLGIGLWYGNIGNCMELWGVLVLEKREERVFIFGVVGTRRIILAWS
jgi:hypothetical protein